MTDPDESALSDDSESNVSPKKDRTRVPPQRRAGQDRRESVVDRRAGLDRRTSSERRAGGDRREESDLPDMQRRRGPGIRRPEERRSAEEGEMTDEQWEFLRAVEEYKRVNNKPFPTWTEVLDVMHKLGYRRAET